ncbi:DUF2267 domain-containing protein [Streptomyces sp. F-1]|uniref:DUF2267 domain-containing protein n=1 Tax=Streptomyces sp. F-1 TaxID=463642 RepID=UPI000868368E|nr:DUF2267 domain-containing protein [Streptomyces sp. F-1]SFY50335.1 hypothetical protein STEPF1_03585 [Streptomyces sp. F-1]
MTTTATTTLTKPRTAEAATKPGTVETAPKRGTADAVPKRGATATVTKPGLAETVPNRGTTDSARWQELTESVREVGQYTTRAEAERVTRIVLSALGGHVTGDERVALAQALPREAGRVIAAQIPATHPLTAREFVESIATRIEGATPATARWDVSSVLSTLAQMIGTSLTTRILAQLPPGYALLFGRAELVTTA